MNGAYYNEIDREKTAWIRQLIERGVVAPGEVDERSIADVCPDDLRGFRQCHFFAGIAVWSYALRLAGWPDDRACWTGSCPCPSFSCAGKGTGFDDPRHLWPEFYRLARVGRPAIVFGEQSADAIGHGWWDLVSTDLESSAYAVAAAVLSSAGVGGSDKRHRLYFVGLANAVRGRQRRRTTSAGCETRASAGIEHGDEAGGVEHPERPRLERHRGHGDDGNESGWFGAGQAGSVGETGSVSGLADTDGGQSRLGNLQPGGQHGLFAQDGSPAERMANAAVSGSGTRHREPRSGERQEIPAGGHDLLVQRHPFPDALKGYWRDADWLFCTDGRWRPVEAGTFPLADGAPFRLGRLRGYGDCINAQVAKAFIGAAMTALGKPDWELAEEATG